MACFRICTVCNRKVITSFCLSSTSVTFFLLHLFLPPKNSMQAIYLKNMGFKDINMICPQKFTAENVRFKIFHFNFNFQRIAFSSFEDLKHVRQMRNGFLVSYFRHEPSASFTVKLNHNVCLFQ